MSGPDLFPCQRRHRSPNWIAGVRIGRKACHFIKLCPGCGLLPRSIVPPDSFFIVSSGGGRHLAGRFQIVYPGLDRCAMRCGTVLLVWCVCRVSLILKWIHALTVSPSRGVVPACEVTVTVERSSTLNDECCFERSGSFRANADGAPLSTAGSGGRPFPLGQWTGFRIADALVLAGKCIGRDSVRVQPAS